MRSIIDMNNAHDANISFCPESASVIHLLDQADR